MNILNQRIKLLPFNQGEHFGQWVKFEAGGCHGAPRRFKRTSDRDHKKLSKDFKDRAAPFFRCSVRWDRSAHWCAASMQRERFAVGDGPMSGHCTR